jgi:hypothetical protein
VIPGTGQEGRGKEGEINAGRMEDRADGATGKEDIQFGENSL